jgi:hypothetical protein
MTAGLNPGMIPHHTHLERISEGDRPMPIIRHIYSKKAIMSCMSTQNESTRLPTLTIT